MHDKTKKRELTTFEQKVQDEILGIAILLLIGIGLIYVVVGVCILIWRVFT